MLYYFKKIIIIFIKIFKGNIKIKFRNPEDLELIVYNSDSMNQLQYVLEEKKYLILDLRLYELKEIYFSFRLILIIFSNLFKFKLSKNYFYSILKVVNPRIVITSCDNHLDFFEMAKLLDDKIKFIAVQNANRIDYARNEHYLKKKITKKNFNHEFYIPNFFCFGQFEIDNCNLYNVKVNNFLKVGSINTSNFFYYLKKNEKKIKKDKFDICLISEPAPDANEVFLEDNIEEGFALIANYTINFAKKFNHKFVFASKRPKYSKLYSDDLYNSEMNFYKKHLNKDNFDFLIKNLNPKENYFSSYFAIFQSKVAVATQSTLLRDKIGVGEKILSCNLTGFKLFDFPINGICTINDCSYEQFEQRLIEVMNISTEEYFKKIDKNKNYVMKFENQYGTIEEIKKEIDKTLKA